MWWVLLAEQLVLFDVYCLAEKKTQRPICSRSTELLRSWIVPLSSTRQAARDVGARQQVRILVQWTFLETTPLQYQAYHSSFVSSTARQGCLLDDTEGPYRW